MEKRRYNHKSASEPMGVLLNNNSRKILKGTYPNKVPQTLVYSNEDYDSLRSLYRELPAPSNLKSYQAWMLIKQELDKSSAYVFDNFVSAIRDRHQNIFDGTVQSEVFKFMFYTEFEKVPLFINHRYLNHLAKWRLSINK